jgi:hypothetical protein
LKLIGTGEDVSCRSMCEIGIGSTRNLVKSDERWWSNMRRFRRRIDDDERLLGDDEGSPSASCTIFVSMMMQAGIEEIPCFPTSIKTKSKTI